MTFIDWAALANPVLAHPDWSFKDACVVYRQGLFHIFTSAFDQDRSTVVHLTTRDWQEYSDFRFQLTGAELDAVGMCSPNIHVHAGRYYLHLNTWGQPKSASNQLYYTASDDLVEWSPLSPVASGLTAGKRCIDLALAHSGDFWVAMWKEGGTARVAVAGSLDGTWRFVDGARACLLRANGHDVADDGLTHENVQLLQIDGRWYLLSTDYDPHEPWLYVMDGDPAEPASWARWVEGYRVLVPSERFNAMPRELDCVIANDFVRPLFPCWDDPDKVHIVDGLSNAPFIADWREHDGFFYLLYAGKNEERRNDFRGRLAGGIRREGWPRGWNRLALARSTDLRDWQVPPGA
ncbi:MAG: hypothetical protein ACOCYP_10675 [Planctomycetota bacterium]